MDSSMSSLSSFTLRGDRLLLERIEVTQVGGVIIPDTVKRGNDQADQFKVLKVGNKVESLLIKEGSIVHAEGYSRFMKDGNKPIYVVREPGVLAVVESC